MRDNPYFSNRVIGPEDVARVARAHMERVEREEREWAEARLHHREHKNWLEPDECPICAEEALNVEGDPTRNGAFG